MRLIVVFVDFYIFFFTGIIGICGVGVGGGCVCVCDALDLIIYFCYALRLNQM